MPDRNETAEAENWFWVIAFSNYFGVICFQNYEQEKYTLQREVELKSRMLESLGCECEAIKQQQKMQLEKLEEQLSRSRTQEVNELKDKVWILCVSENSILCSHSHL